MSISHRSACSADVVGLGNYRIDHAYTTSFVVEGDKYMDIGITSSSYVLCEKSCAFSTGDLLAVSDIEKNRIELVYQIPPDMVFLGRVIMAVKQFGQ